MLKENGKYRIIQACYWMMISIIFGYATFYLERFGYSTGECGMIIAGFGIASAVVQPVVGRIADQSRRFHWKNLLLILAALCGLSLVLLLVWPLDGGVGLLFGFITLFINCMIALINAACFYYEKKGIPINFGIARGIGSLSYAAVSVILGWVTVRLGTIAVPLAGIPVILVMLVTVLRMPFEKEAQTAETDNEEAGKEVTAKEATAKEVTVKKATVKAEADTCGDRNGSTNFLKKYPVFFVMALGTVFVFAVHNLTSTYLLQQFEAVGGDSSNLGVALAIAAATEAPVMIFFSKIAKKIPEKYLLVAGGIFYGVKSLIMLMAGNVAMIYAAQCLQPLSYGLYASASVYFTDHCIEREDMVTGQALLSMAMSVGGFIGNLSGGWLIDLGGVRQMLMISTWLAVAAVAVLWAAVRMQGGRRK